MAATSITIAQATYPTGNYGPFAISIQPNTTRCTASFSRVAFPGVSADIVAIATLLWSDGSGARCNLMGGTTLDRFGAPNSSISINVPLEPDGAGVKRRAVTSAQLTIRVLQAVTTEILLKTT